MAAIGDGSMKEAYYCSADKYERRFSLVAEPAPSLSPTPLASCVLASASKALKRLKRATRLAVHSVYLQRFGPSVLPRSKFITLTAAGRDWSRFALKVADGKQVFRLLRLGPLQHPKIPFLPMMKAGKYPHSNAGGRCFKTSQPVVHCKSGLHFP